VSEPAPFFVFEHFVTPVLDEPRSCRSCSAELEALRRSGGLCKACIERRASSLPPAAAPTDHLCSRMTLVRTFYRQRADHREKFVEAECSCTRRRVMQWSTWVHRRPRYCNLCRLKDVEANGFFAEHLR
jgi:hypothetical protein